jgi:hypothetical protein
MARLALGRWWGCGVFPASRSEAAFRCASRPSREASATPPMPVAKRARKLRRSRAERGGPGHSAFGSPAVASIPEPTEQSNCCGVEGRAP